MGKVTFKKMLKYDYDNPDIYRIFEKFTFQAIGMGKTRLGADLVVARARWYATVETKTGEYKVSNSFRAYLSRKFMLKYPNHKGFFATRASVADEMDMKHYDENWVPKPEFFADETFEGL